MLGKEKKSQQLDETGQVLKELKDLYLKTVRPIEQITNFERMGHGILNEGDFDSPPLILLVGPYSAGKTTMLEYLIGKEFPGERVGPEPTTDKFSAIMHGEDERVIPGNALTVSPGSPFSGLQNFGNDFLMRFEGAQVCDCELLKNLTLIDSPGVLSGEKQTLGRSYDYAKVVEWFAARSDMIILLFDVQKCDISDEMACSIKNLDKYADKVKVILNKSDSVSHQHLMKVYGALLWSLGRVIKTPEVVKVYIGSFWGEPLKNEETEALIKREMADFLRDLNDLSRLGAVRKINDMVKRIRLIRVYVILLDYLRDQMPKMFNKHKKKQELLDDLPNIFRTVMKQHGLSFGDFPDIDLFRKTIESLDFDKFPKLKGKRMNQGKRMTDLNKMLKNNIPDMLNRLPGMRQHKLPTKHETSRKKAGEKKVEAKESDIDKSEATDVEVVDAEANAAEGDTAEAKHTVEANKAEDP
mmetsp:Transcript_9458/g.14217  ORF Transcript_9458/g.14217 Transcript_9458/m.14217 type:complete len:469 (-) Transcript_9458:111-1517(-)